MNSDLKTLSKEQIEEILVAGNYVTKEDFEMVAIQVSNNDQIISSMITKGLLDKDLWGQALAEFYDVAYADLNSHPPAKEAVLRLPEDIARQYRLVIFDENDDEVVLTTDTLESKDSIIEQLRSVISGKQIIFALSLSEDIDKVLSMYRKPLQVRLDKISSSRNETAPEVLHEIISEAKLLNASDVHFEPVVNQNPVTVRLRVDGVLQRLATLPVSVYENLLNHLKIISNLRIDEHQRVQDGAMRFVLLDKKIDVRVSVAPTLAGEKVTLRILSEYVEHFSPEALGMNVDQVAVLKRVARKPFGMMIVCGPTGSGKTTTAYTILNDVSDESINITTIEDPAEYRMKNINQIQVRPEFGITFAEGLRSIVRQDPDVIFVGEIRDRETAAIAVNAALTGHLLLSTFHATSAATALPRLLEMGIEPFMLASTVSVVVGQRLIRKLCISCRYSEEVSQKYLGKSLDNPAAYFDDKKVTLYRSKGCSACNGSGFLGRTVLVEVLEVDELVRQLVIKGAAAKQIEEVARKNGMATLFEDGITKVKDGVTSLEELLRVVEEPSN